MKKIVMFFVLIFQFIVISFQRKVFAEGEQEQTGDCEDTKPPINLSFGEALQIIKGGHKVCREGWNGKNMFLYLNKGSIDDSNGKTRPSKIEGINTELFSSGFEGTTTRLPCINMQSAQGNTVTGWLASQTDMLAEDWMLV